MSANLQCLNKHHLITFLAHPDGYMELKAKDEHGRTYTQRIELAYSWDRCHDGMGELLMALAVYGFSALYGLNPADRVYDDAPAARPHSDIILVP